MEWGVEKQVGGRSETETVGAQTGSFPPKLLGSNWTHLANAYYVPETPSVLSHEMPSLNRTGQDWFKTSAENCISII